MATTTSSDSLTIALIGNPNTGKSTLFNALSGGKQRIGNFPGVTVEKKTGKATIYNQSIELIDLPGTYSIAPRSPDEMVAVEVLLNRRSDTDQIDGVICILDASSLERNLYLLSQVRELGIPTIVALNMLDVAESKKIKIDEKKLEKNLGLPVVAIQANKKVGIDQLKSEILKLKDQAEHAVDSGFPDEFHQAVDSLSDYIKSENPEANVPKYLIERLLLDNGTYMSETIKEFSSEKVINRVREAQATLKEAGYPVPAVEAMSRYKWVGEVLSGVLVYPDERPKLLTDKIDRILTHKFWGLFVFFLLMLVMFQCVFTLSEKPMELIEAGQEALSTVFTGTETEPGLMAEGPLRSLIVDGIIGGVGAVVIFLPQIIILFFFLSVLEDCGYMARAAYLMDKFMSKIGLSGKSFIPMLSSFGCAIPGVMATRVIESKKDRMITILVAPLMSCSARMPVYVLFTTALIPATILIQAPFEIMGWSPAITLRALTMVGMYLIGILTAVVVAFALKKTYFKGETPPFVMELPTYKLPQASVVVRRLLERSGAFLYRAGTLIFAVTVIIWASLYFPQNVESITAKYADEVATIEKNDAQLPDEEVKSLLADIDNKIEGEQYAQSLLGRLGQWIEPAVEPLGWDWKIGCGVIASFPAREVIVATLATIYNQGSDQDEESLSLQEQIQNATWPEGSKRAGQKVYNVPVGLSIMVFFALCAQCVATLAVIKRETNSWYWPIFSFVYMTVLAYIGAFVTYQVGMLFV